MNIQNIKYRRWQNKNREVTKYKGSFYQGNHAKWKVGHVFAHIKLFQYRDIVCDIAHSVYIIHFYCPVTLSMFGCIFRAQQCGRIYSISLCLLLKKLMSLSPTGSGECSPWWIWALPPSSCHPPTPGSQLGSPGQSCLSFSSCLLMWRHKNG